MDPQHSLEVMSSRINLTLGEHENNSQRKRRRTSSEDGSKRQRTATHQDMELSDGDDDIKIVEPSAPQSPDEVEEVFLMDVFFIHAFLLSCHINSCTVVPGH